MNILKFGRGDFFGIIIPGAFLVLNLLFLLPHDYISWLTTQIPSEWTGKEVTVFIGLLVVSYALGFGLRLINPSHLEVISYPLHLPEILLQPLFWFLTGRGIASKQAFRLTVRERMKAFWEPFPYIEYFYSSYFTRSAKSYRAFFEDFLRDEFNGNKDLMKGTRFINQCKIYILEHSKTLSDEITFNEGLVRFLSGMVCALIASLLVAAVRGGPGIVFVGYVLLAVLFLYRLRFIRVKEVAAVFTAFACLAGGFCKR